MKQKAGPQTRTTALWNQNVIQLHIYRNKNSLQVQEKRNLKIVCGFTQGYIDINPLNAELNPVCHLLALLGAHPILYVSRIRVKYGYCIAGPSGRAV